MKNIKNLILVGLVFLTALIPTSAQTWGTLAGGTFGTGAGGGGGTPSYATPAHVQSNSGYSSGPATLAGNATSGNLLVVWISGGGTIASTTLSGGGVSSWTALTQYSPTEGVAYGRWYYGITTGGAVSITISDPPTDPGWSIYEISGIASSSPLDQSAGQEDYFDGTYTSGNVNTTLANEAMIGAWANENDDPSVSWGSGWGNTTLQSSHAHGTALKIVSEKGTYAASGTDDAGGTYGIVSIITFKAAEL